MLFEQGSPDAARDYKGRRDIVTPRRKTGVNSMADGERIEGERAPAQIDGASPDAEALAALLRDLAELRDYLIARGQHTYELAQRFLQNARRDTPERGYDERQATMLEYQNYIWHEIAGRVDQLVARYGGVTHEAPERSSGLPDESPHAAGTTGEDD